LTAPILGTPTFSEARGKRRFFEHGEEPMHLRFVRVPRGPAPLEFQQAP